MSVYIGIETRDVRPEELGGAAELVARGMLDNPLHIAAFGGEAARRGRRLGAVFGAALPTLAAKGVMIGAYKGGALVGVAGVVEPGRCQPRGIESLRLLPRILPSVGPASLARMGKWMRAWGEHDPGEPHWHLGPVAVDRDLQRQGVGSALMEHVCDRVDRVSGLLYLETDKPGNVEFYRRYGFETIGEAMVLGVPNWFMKREAQPVALGHGAISERRQ